MRLRELAIRQFASNRCHRANSVSKTLVRQQRRDGDQPVGATRGRETFQATSGLVAIDSQVLHDRHQPIRTPANPDPRQRLDPLANRLDQLLVNRSLGLFARQTHQHQFFGSKSLLETVINPPCRCLAWQPRLDVVVRGQRLGSEEQVGERQDQKSQHESAVPTEELGQHEASSRKAVRDVNQCGNRRLWPGHCHNQQKARQCVDQDGRLLLTIESTTEQP